MDVKQYISEHILVFDGAMGTMLQKKGLKTGDLPECFNITHPEIVSEIHREYVQAGSDMITTNTFQANRFKLEHCEYSVEQLITAGVKLAKQSGSKFVALDIGPLGQLMEPMGTLKFEEAYEAFREQMVAGEQAGADCILLETMSDLYEVKAAILAAKEHTKLPVFCTLTYQEDGRTFVGADPVTGTITLQSLGVDALGVNCSLGPKELTPVVEQILTYATVPVMVQANAGLPQIREGQTVYDVTPEEFVRYVRPMVEQGVRIIGGCCGTTPDFIRGLREVADQLPVVSNHPKRVTAVTSGTTTVILDDGVTVIGERINPTGKKKLKEALRSHHMDYIIGEAIDQTQSGADVLDINVGLPEIDEAAMIAEVIREVQSVSNLPIQVDSSDIAAIESGVRACNGRPIINSVNGKAENMAQVFPIVKKYGAVVVGLTLDESGIPQHAEDRFAIAKKIVDTTATYGIPKEDILIDCLTLTASAQQDAVLDTLHAIQLVKQRLGVKTVLGVSNVSFGLPNRPLLNSIFLSAAFGAGLDAPILNPMSVDMMKAVDTFRVINCQDRDATYYIEKYANTDQTTAAVVGDLDLKDMIIQGRKEEAAVKVQEMLQTIPPLDLIDQYFIPALDVVGDRYEKGKIFLPQLMQSAEAVKASFEVLKANFSEGEKTASKGKIIVATVLGDIHDIGKNIAKMLLENYGYDVIDLGKDVPIEKVVQTAKEQKIQLVGLSALMTTTVKNMKDTITAIRDAGLNCKVMVGGAVLNEEYADFVGADYYVKDGREGVQIAQRLFNE
ncbi:homocysteine S-methyltransferase family protein [Massilioclostridium coli]|uniref:homocysteine S-methyltransferase family protein n=1 Tax=Massilioclostridium coli TaxID=1870991 RepID=UPI0022DF046E|nr:homocysteine S-methyltransferase family protein [Massilioclostridium coli]